MNNDIFEKLTQDVNTSAKGMPQAKQTDAPIKAVFTSSGSAVRNLILPITPTPTISNAHPNS